jgi:hypothetical protein
MWFSREVDEVWITLMKGDMARSDPVGEKRFNEMRKSGVPLEYGLTVLDDIMAARAELAYCLLAEKEWPASVNTFKNEPDVYPDIEVRVARRHYYKLIVRPDDIFARRFNLVTTDDVRSDTFCIRGWCWGREAKRGEYLRDYNNRKAAWFVPQGHLRKIGTME